MHAFSFKSLASLAWAAIPIMANPIGVNPTDLVERGNSSLEARAVHPLKSGLGIAQLVIAVRDFLKGENAYDPSVPNKCNLFITTTSGSHCTACLLCANTDDYRKCYQPEIIPGPGPGWNTCFLGGRQYMRHKEIGEFSVTFTKAGGKDGDTTDGLHTPIVQFANLNNWEPWDIEKVIAEQGDKDEGNLCHRKNHGANQQLGWECGIPKLGGGAAFGIQLQGSDSPSAGFTPGWCTAHVVQYQRNEFGVGDAFEFDLTLFDADKKQIGKVSHLKVDDKGKASFTSRLPWTIEIEAKRSDTDFVTFAYANQRWTCDDGDGGAHGCTLGNGEEWGFENGNREGDFGFTC